MNSYRQVLKVREMCVNNVNRVFFLIILLYQALQVIVHPPLFSFKHRALRQGEGGGGGAAGERKGMEGKDK